MKIDGFALRMVQYPHISSMSSAWFVFGQYRNRRFVGLVVRLGNLCIFDGHNFSEFSSNGQPYSSILFILGDLEDNVWFGGSDGIWKFDGESVMKMTK
jgi:hypothetical protein